MLSAKKTRINRKREILRMTLLLIIFILVANSRTEKINTFGLPEEIILVTYFIPIIIGIIFGSRSGAMIGFFGPMANNIINNNMNPMDFALISGYVVGGYVSGLLREKIPSPIIALTFALTYLVNLIVLLLFGRISLDFFTNMFIIAGLVYEIFIGVITIIIINVIYRIGFYNRVK